MYQPDQQCYYCNNRGEMQHGNKVQCYSPSSEVSGVGYYEVDGYPRSYRPDHLRVRCPNWQLREYQAAEEV